MTTVRTLRRRAALRLELLVCVLGPSIVGLPCAWAGEISVVDGVPHVRNDAEPSEGSETITPRETWRRGGPDDDIFFGNIARIDQDAEGNLYILDTQQCEITVLGPDGSFLRTLGRRGEGPGELYRPADFYLRGGGGVGLMQQFPGKIVLVDENGDPDGEFALSSAGGSTSNFMALVDSRSRADHVVIAGIEMAYEGSLTRQHYFLSAIDEAGHRMTTYLSKENTISFADFVASEETMDFVWWGQRWAMAPGGLLLANVDRNRYRIEVFDADGTLQRVVERDYESWKRTDTERAESERVLRAAVSGYPVPPRSLEVKPTDPDLNAIYARGDGSFWVRTSRGDRPKHEKTLTVVDVFDPEGNFVRQLELRMPGNIGVDALYVCGDRILQVTNSLDAYVAGQAGGDAEEATDDAPPEEKELEIICYEL